MDLASLQYQIFIENEGIDDSIEAYNQWRVANGMEEDWGGTACCTDTYWLGYLGYGGINEDPQEVRDNWMRMHLNGKHAVLTSVYRYEFSMA